MTLLEELQHRRILKGWGIRHIDNTLSIHQHISESRTRNGVDT